jgi:hypothetical protein
VAKRVSILCGSATDLRVDLRLRTYVGNSESAGINRHVVGDARALQERE